MLMTGIANHLVSPLERNFNWNFSFDSRLVGLRWHFILVEPSVVHLHEGTLVYIYIYISIYIYTNVLPSISIDEGILRHCSLVAFAESSDYFLWT